MKSLLTPAARVLAALLLTSSGLHAAATMTVDWTVNSTIPDNNPTGLADTRTITDSPIGFITSIEVRFQTSGGWNGDLYAFLSHDSGFSVLLNRPGKTLMDLIGSSASGFNVTFSDDAVSDIHNAAGSGTITGTYQPDARDVDPDTVLDTDSRTAYLSNFQGLSANGDWTLFVADNAAGDNATLTSWGMTISGTPEPSRAMLLMIGICALIARRRKA